MNKKEFIKSQKECASLLGLSLAEYNKEIKNIKCSKFKDISKKNQKDDLLKVLGINKQDLKKKAR